MLLSRDFADNFAAHATIEEEIFYPQAYGDQTKELLTEAVEERLSGQASNRGPARARARRHEEYVAKLKVLKEQIQHHVKEEEG